MLCEYCGKNEATGYMEKTVNGVKTRMHLCSKCIFEKQKEMFSSAFGMFSVNEPALKKGVCSKCGRRLKDIVSSGFVGCNECYSELYDRLLPVVKNIQSAATHTGKAPDGAVSDGSMISKLEAELKHAVETENYEQAGVISNKLKKLKEKSDVQ